MADPMDARLGDLAPGISLDRCRRVCYGIGKRLEMGRRLPPVPRNDEPGLKSERGSIPEGDGHRRSHS
jgi:hypothetical protein